MDGGEGHDEVTLDFPDRRDEAFPSCIALLKMPSLRRSGGNEAGVPWAHPQTPTRHATQEKGLLQ